VLLLYGNKRCSSEEFAIAAFAFSLLRAKDSKTGKCPIDKCKHRISDMDFPSKKYIASS